MSGWSEARDCPYCNGKDTLEAWGDRFSVGGTCLECGYSYRTIEEQMTLDEVNETRKDCDMEPLTALKPSTFKEDSKE